MVKLPQFCKVFIPEVKYSVYFFKTMEKKIKFRGENLFLSENEVLYRNSYGREVIVDVETMKITFPNLDFYKNRNITPVSIQEFGNGFKKYENDELF